jgi:hypothetical protein
MKTLGLTTVVLSALLLTGCGGGGSKGDPIKKKNYVVIWTEVQVGRCESQDFRNILIQAGASNDVIVKETAMNTSCATYGKQNNGNECYMAYVGGGDRNCVAGFNGYTGSNKQTKLIGEIELSDISNIVASEI